MTTAERHEAICDQFLDHAEDELRSGDLLQAAEKAWGAFAHCINSIAKRRGWKVGTHQRLKANANRLIDRDLEQAAYRRLLLGAVESLHVNFYQELMTEDEVRRGIDNARELVDALRDLANR
ncbi:MAG: hypothetical protein OXC06_05840 [Acidimicrobiaceae bacterium]|nr:hypothetical protein [Acidimicrobiaceae bacterium]